MSKLDELIKEYCPDGVKYIPIKKCVNSVEKIRWSDSDMESYQYIDLSSVNRDTHLISDITTIDKDNAPSRAQQIVQEGDIIFGTTRPMLKRYCMIDVNYDGQICSTGFCVLRADDNIILNSWLYHNITSSSFFDHVEKLQKGASYPAISDANVKSFKIPVPPLPVQEEIVRILDSFTSLTAELQAELQARKKQYEYYADKLFVSDIPIEDWMSVGDTIQSLNTGLNPRQSFKLNVGGDKPYITGKNIYNNSINVSEKTDLITDDVISLINKRACLATGDVLFASTGTGTVGRMAVVDNYDFSWSVSETIFCLKPKKSVIHPYYLMYALYTQSAKNQFEPRISKGSVPH